MRLEAYDLSLLLNTHLMVLRPLENFVLAFEVVRGEILGSLTKIAINHRFQPFRKYILGIKEDFFNSNHRTG